MAGDESAVIRKRLGAKLREMRKYLRGDAEVPPSQDMICIWIELAHVLECYNDVIDLSQRVYEAEVDPFLYRRVRSLTRLAKVKVAAASGGANAG